MIEIDPPALREFQPEVVLLGTSKIQRSLAEKLRAEGFTVIFEDPRTLHQIYEWIRALGAIFDRRKEADALILKMQQGFNDVKKKAALLPKKPRVYIEEWHQPPFASGNWVPEMISCAGGISFPLKAGELSREVTLEEVAKFDPDLIVISWCGAGHLAEKKLLMERAGWE